MVCAAVNHGGNRQYKIAGRRQRQEEKAVAKWGVSREARNSERVAKMTVLARVRLGRAGRLRAGA
jgi:hypothetical protein